MSKFKCWREIVWNPVLVRFQFSNKYDFEYKKYKCSTNEDITIKSTIVWCESNTLASLVEGQVEFFYHIKYYKIFSSCPGRPLPPNSKRSSNMVIYNFRFDQACGGTHIRIFRYIWKLIICINTYKVMFMLISRMIWKYLK